MNFFDYLDKHGFYAFIFFVWCIPLASWFVVTIMDRFLLTFRRVLRSINILFYGWPPSHLDADGDAIKVTANGTKSAKKDDET